MTAGQRRLTVAAVLVAAACSGGNVDEPLKGHAEIASRSTTLSVGDTMTLNPGILYDDGRWVPAAEAALTVENTTIASVDPSTHLLLGKAPGIAVVVLEIPQVGTLKKNYNIIP